MSSTLDHYFSNLSLRLSEVLDDIGVSEALVRKRRTLLPTDIMQNIPTSQCNRIEFLFEYNSEDLKLFELSVCDRPTVEFSEEHSYEEQLLHGQIKKTFSGCCLQPTYLHRTQSSQNDKITIDNRTIAYILPDRGRHNDIYYIQHLDTGLVASVHRHVETDVMIKQYSMMKAIEIAAKDHHFVFFDQINVEGVNRELIWTFSTSEAEKRLLKSQNFVKVGCYIIIKIVLSNYLKTLLGNTITSCMYTTVSLNTVAYSGYRNSSWSALNIATLFQCWQKYVEYTSTEDCPTFVTSWTNLHFRNTSETDTPHILSGKSGESLHYIVLMILLKQNSENLFSADRITFPESPALPSVVSKLSQFERKEKSLDENILLRNRSNMFSKYPMPRKLYQAEWSPFKHFILHLCTGLSLTPRSECIDQSWTFSSEVLQGLSAEKLYLRLIKARYCDTELRRNIIHESVDVEKNDEISTDVSQSTFVPLLLTELGQLYNENVVVVNTKKTERKELSSMTFMMSYSFVLQYLNKYIETNICQDEAADFSMIKREATNQSERQNNERKPFAKETNPQGNSNFKTSRNIKIPISESNVDAGELFCDVQSKRKFRPSVFPELQSAGFDLSGLTVAIKRPTSTNRSFSGHHDTKYLKKYKTKQEERTFWKKKVDATFTEAEFGKITSVRDYTWLPMDQLPVPRVDITVAFVPAFPPLMAIIDQIAAGKPPAPHVSMRYELLRFCTLRSYPTEDKPYLTLLAAAGFYYASDGDGVVCYCCGIRRYNWTADDNPMKIHRRINPTCKFLTKNEEMNVINDFNGPFSKSLMFIDSIPEPGESQEPVEDINNDWAPERTRSHAPRPQNESTPSKAGINTAMPKHSQYATKTSRIASFNGWPDTASHSPDTLADAGFFYAGYGDCVRCFYCGIGLRHWTQDDNPWIEHARWSKNCVFVKQKKGEEFLSLVQLAVQYAENSESQESIAENQQLPPQEIENILLSDAAQSVLEMGYQPRIIKKAIEQILRQDRQAKITAQSLMEKVLEIEEADKPTQVPQVPPAAAATATVGPTEGATCSAPDESAKFDQKVNENKLAEKKNTSENIKGEHKIKPAKSGEGGKVYGSNDASHIDPKAIKAENEQLKEQTLCKVCLDQTVSIVFLPCGHLVTCADCAPAMRTCPICRATVKGTVKTYMA